VRRGRAAHGARGAGGGGTGDSSPPRATRKFVTHRNHVYAGGARVFRGDGAGSGRLHPFPRLFGLVPGPKHASFVHMLFLSCVFALSQ
jgi:hypothetical protein